QSARAQADGRRLFADPRQDGGRRLVSATAPSPARPSSPAPDRVALWTVRMSLGRVYVIGAGLAGLSCAVALAKKGITVELIEAAGFAGGRCRSYHDASLDQVIDNGNHLILSGNTAVHDYLCTIGSERNFVEPANAAFAFADVRSGARWTIKPN